MTTSDREGMLTADVRAYVALKRSLGIAFATEAGILQRFDRYVTRCHPDVVGLSRPVLEAWFNDRPNLTALTRAHQLGVVRQLCLYRRRFNSSAYVPDKIRDAGLWPARIPRRRPYILCVDEVRQLLRTARDLTSRRDHPFRSGAYEATALANSSVSGPDEQSKSEGESPSFLAQRGFRFLARESLPGPMPSSVLVKPGSMVARSSRIESSLGASMSSLPRPPRRLGWPGESASMVARSSCRDSDLGASMEA